jgi:divalent metal cation (Fe/Co/Zn/Cd) transporter
VLKRFERDGINFHALRTRQAGQRAFISLHVLVPGDWPVQRGHDVVEQIEAALRERLPYATVFTHLEPADDPRSFADTTLDRNEMESTSAAGTRSSSPSRSGFPTQS